MNTDKIYAQSIANEYSAKKTSKVVALKKLDHRVKLPANIFTYTFGIFASLILGIGMCLCMQVIGNASTAMFVLGVILGIIGIAGISINYIIYKKILQSRKNKYASDILLLAKEIEEGE